MQHVENSIAISAKPAEVYAYLKQPNKLGEWMVSLNEVTNIQGEGVGQTYEWTYRMAGVPLKGKTTVVEDEPSTYIMTKTEGGVKSTWRFTLTPVGEGTKLTLAIDYEVPLPVVGKLAEKLVVKRNAREMEINLENIKQMVES
jgi:carbon monoxide dehydrogenase subunit G